MADSGGTKILAIVTVIIILFSIGLSGCIGDEKDDKKFLVSCGNGDTVSHNVQAIIIDENDKEIFNSTKTIEPETTEDLFRSYDLPDKEYTVIVIIDNNWTDSIKHHPSSTSCVSLSISSPNAHDLYIKHKD